MSRLGLRDPRTPGGVKGDQRVALKSESTWTDETAYVGRVKRNGGVQGLAEAGYASTSRRSHSGQVEMDGLGGLDLKTTMQAGLPVWTPKPEARPVAGWPSRRALGRIAKLASRRSKIMKTACPFDASAMSRTKIPLRGWLS
jgi:hypothetical protein